MVEFTNLNALSHIFPKVLNLHLCQFCTDVLEMVTDIELQKGTTRN